MLRERSSARIILVAGPSGSGKSAFIQQLQSAALPITLQSRFPLQIGSWAVVEANDVLKRGSGGLPKQGPRELILHYDTALMRRFGLRCYDEDPIFALLPREVALIVVSLAPDPTRLAEQFEARLQWQRAQKGLLRSSWRQAISPVRRLFRLLRGGHSIDTSRIYRDPQCLQQLYDDWEVFARTLARHNPASQHIRVQPVGDGSFAYDCKH
jgi:hypothetical protein